MSRDKASEDKLREIFQNATKYRYRDDISRSYYSGIFDAIYNINPDFLMELTTERDKEATP